MRFHKMSVYTKKIEDQQALCGRCQGVSEKGLGHRFGQSDSLLLIIIIILLKMIKITIKIKIMK